MKHINYMYVALLLVVSILLNTALFIAEAMGIPQSFLWSTKGFVIGMGGMWFLSRLDKSKKA